MWVFTVDGFYSAVNYMPGGNELVVRARFKEDLVHILKKVGATRIIETPVRDYPYRIFVTKKAWAKYLADSVMELDYSNFKDRVLPKATSDRRTRYHNVWADMAYGTKAPDWARI